MPLSTTPFSPDHRAAPAEEDAQVFSDQGFTVIRSCLAPAAVAAVAKEATRAIVRHRPGPPERDREDPIARSLQIRNAWQLSDAVRWLVCSRRLAQMAARFLPGGGVQLYSDLVVLKEPTAEQSPWHTDAAHVPVSGDAFLVAYVPLHPAGPQRAGLGFRAGSHRLPVARDFKPTSAVQLRRINKTLDAAQASVAEPTFQPGDVAFYSGLTFHRLCANQSESPIASLWVYYIPEGQTLMRPRNAFQALERELHFSDVSVGRPIVTTLNPRLWHR